MFGIPFSCLLHFYNIFRSSLINIDQHSTSVFLFVKQKFFYYVWQLMFSIFKSLKKILEIFMLFYRAT